MKCTKSLELSSLFCFDFLGQPRTVDKFRSKMKDAKHGDDTYCSPEKEIHCLLSPFFWKKQKIGFVNKHQLKILSKIVNVVRSLRKVTESLPGGMRQQRMHMARENNTTEGKVSHFQSRSCARGEGRVSPWLEGSTTKLPRKRSIESWNGEI